MAYSLGSIFQIVPRHRALELTKQFGRHYFPVSRDATALLTRSVRDR
ncbi:MAG: hypothetical protein ABSG20_13345 [Bradyrhizobium sp.]|jgi:hypothetical protein